MAWFGDNKIGRIGRFFGNDPTLVGYWQLNGSSIDNSGNGNNGTDHSVIYSPQNGRLNNGADIVHANAAYISSSGNASIPTGAAARTFGIWFKTTVPSGTNQSIFGSGTSASNEQFVLYMVSGKDYFSGYAADIQGNIVINDGEWHLFIVTYDGSNARLYVDGKYDATYTGTLATTGTSIYIGCGPGLTGDSFTGSLWEPFILNRVMSPSQISQYYAWATRKPQNWMQKAIASTGISYVITAAQGAYTYTGFAVSFIKNLGIALAQGAYTYTGVAVSFIRTRVMAIVTGLYSLTGFAVIIINKSWAFRTKHPASWSNRVKNIATWSNKAKNAASWFFRNKS